MIDNKQLNNCLVSSVGLVSQSSLFLLVSVSEGGHIYSFLVVKIYKELRAKNITSYILTEPEVMTVSLFTFYGAECNKSAGLSDQMLSNVFHWGNIRRKSPL